MKEQHFNCRAVCLAVIFFCAFNSVNSYSKYGRSCADIGCTPSEVCIMAQESCSYGQRDGKDCGSYPTCKRNPNGGSMKPSDDGGASSHTSSHNLNADSGPSYNGGGSSSGSPGGGNTAGGFDGFSASGHNLYPQLPTSNNPSQPNPAGGYGGYNNINSGGYTPPSGGYHPSAGGYHPPQGGYHPPQGGYSQGGGGYNRPSQPEPAGPKDKNGGFFSNFLSSPIVTQAISGIISGQVQKALQGGGSQGGNRNDYTPSGGYSSGGGGGGGGGGSSILGGLFGSVLSGGGSQSSSQSSGLGMLGDLIGGGGNRGSSSTGGIGDYFKSSNFKGLFNEKPSTNNG